VKNFDKCYRAVGFLSQMMYSLSPTAQDIVAGSSVAAKLHPNPKTPSLWQGALFDR
jgi:hypothetical protein